MSKSDDAYKTIGEVVKILDLKVDQVKKHPLTQLDLGKRV